MAPTTEFEDTGGSSWTSLANEQTFLETIDAETDAVMSQAGTSQLGNPLWRMDIGDPSNGTLMIVGHQHGFERASREAALQHVRDVAYSTDPAITGYLSSHRLVYMCDANPDDWSADNDNVDINRDHWTLQFPEARAVQDVIVDTRPVMLLDHHDRGSKDPGVSMEYRRPELLALYSGIGTLGDDYLSDLGDEFDSQSVTHGLYPDPGRSSLRESAGLHHSLGILLETVRTDAVLDRVAYHLTACEVAVTWHDANDDALASMVTASKNYQATTSDTYILEQGGTDVYPWPTVTLPADLVGYQLTGGVVPQAFGVYGVRVVQGSIVELSQEARAIVPILLDSQSDDQLAGAVRLTELPSPADTATVAQFAEVVSGSQDMVVEARVLTSFQTGNNPTGEQIAILGGDVTFDATAENFGTLTLTTEGLDERGDSLFPRRAGDLLAPYGNEIFVRRGVDIGSETLWSPLGYFRIDEDNQDRDSDQPITLECPDRMQGIIDGELVSPRQFLPDRTVSSVVGELVREIYPAAVVSFDDSSGDDLLGRQLMVEKDRYGALLDVTKSLGKIVYWGGDGVLRIEDPPDLETILWEMRAGSDGVVVDLDRRVTRRGMYNAVVARGEGADTVAPVQAVAVDAGATSPTRWFPPDDPTELWFGQVPRRYSSPLLNTEAKALKAGRSLLRRYLGMPYTIDFNVVPNPAIRPHHVVRIQGKDGNRDKHILDQVVVPLTHNASMTGLTRELTRVQIGQL